MVIDVEGKLERVYGGLAPDPRMRDRILASLSARRPTGGRRRIPVRAAVAAAACLVVIAALWVDGGRPQDPRARLLLVTEGEAAAVIPVMEARLAARGIEGVVIRLAGPQGEIEILFPPDVRRDEVADLLMRSGTLEFRILASPREEPGDPQGRFDGADLDPGSIEVRPAGVQPGWVVHFSMRAERREDFSEFTARNIGRRMAIVLDGEVETSPVIQERLPGGGFISGGGAEGFTRDEAEALAAVLLSGPLPHDVRRR